MGGRHKKKRRVSLTPLGFVTLLVVLAITLSLVFISCNPDNTGSDTGSVPEEPKDVTAPVIEVVSDIVVYEDATVSYRKFIEFSDDSGEAPSLEIDSSGVDLQTPGSYEVIFTVTDAAGNKSTATVNVTVNKKPNDYVEPEVIYDLADTALL